MLALGKVPGPEAESASREGASFHRDSFWRRSDCWATKSEEDVLSKHSYAGSSLHGLRSDGDVNSTGLTLLCPKHFYIWESQWSLCYDLCARWIQCVHLVLPRASWAILNSINTPLQSSLISINYQVFQSILPWMSLVNISLIPYYRFCRNTGSKGQF